eukprot:TRINITY_DN2305_c0_g2_i1.p1 TRINITY_DN2305_c0_g2~~TRINITY_DN2305_c0_g2_i1.p1  ORF type:complete len:335 (+),score=19.93 TRINITY_DN2305_c0_g2_i1:55-1059(+)
MPSPRSEAVPRSLDQTEQQQPKTPEQQQPKTADLKNSVTTVMLMGLNIVSVVSIVILNKKIFSQDVKFSFPNILMAFHFIVTAIGVYVYQKAGGFPLPETSPGIKTTLPIACYQVLSVMFVNYSLVYNSVGLYQVLKLANIPVLCVMEFFWKGISYPLAIKLSLSLLVAGIGVTTVTDVSVNQWGLIHGMLATVTTGALQIQVKDISKGMTSQQSCYYVAPLSACIFSAISLVTDNWVLFMNFTYTPVATLLLLCSGFAAFLINFTLFVIVGKTSPVTYQVVGHIKTILVIICGFLFFAAPVHMRNVVGMAVAMAGVIWYTREKLKPKEPENGP